MTSDKLARDYLKRGRIRREALQLLYDRGTFSDVVRESQEILELLLKGSLRFVGIDPPRRHDVGRALLHSESRFPTEVRGEIRDLAAASAKLAEERSAAFYGDEDAAVAASELFDSAAAVEALVVVDRALAWYERLLGDGARTGGA